MDKKLLALLGSPHKDGATGTMLKYVLQIAGQQGWQIEFVNLYEQRIGYCNGCRVCIKTGNCVQKDDVQKISRLIRECDMVVLAAPFSFLCGQSTGAIRSMKEFFKASGMKYAGKCVWAGQDKKTLPIHIKKKIENILK